MVEVSLVAKGRRREREIVRETERRRVVAREVDNSKVNSRIPKANEGLG